MTPYLEGEKKMKDTDDGNYKTNFLVKGVPISNLRIIIKKDLFFNVSKEGWKSQVPKTQTSLFSGLQNFLFLISILSHIWLLTQVL